MIDWDQMVESVTHRWKVGAAITDDRRACILGAATLQVEPSSNRVIYSLPEVIEVARTLAPIICEQYPSWGQMIARLADDPCQVVWRFNDGNDHQSVVAIVEKARANA